MINEKNFFFDELTKPPKVVTGQNKITPKKKETIEENLRRKELELFVKVKEDKFVINTDDKIVLLYTILRTDVSKCYSTLDKRLQTSSNPLNPHLTKLFRSYCNINYHKVRTQKMNIALFQRKLVDKPCRISWSTNKSVATMQSKVNRDEFPKSFLCKNALLAKAVMEVFKTRRWHSLILWTNQFQWYEEDTEGNYAEIKQKLLRYRSNLEIPFGDRYCIDYGDYCKTDMAEKLYRYLCDRTGAFQIQTATAFKNAITKFKKSDNIFGVQNKRNILFSKIERATFGKAIKMALRAYYPEGYLSNYAFSMICVARMLEEVGWEGANDIGANDISVAPFIKHAYSWITKKPGNLSFGSSDLPFGSSGLNIQNKVLTRLKKLLTFSPEVEKVLAEYEIQKYFLDKKWNPQKAEPKNNEHCCTYMKCLLKLHAKISQIGNENHLSIFQTWLENQAYYMRALTDIEIYFPRFRSTRLKIDSTVSVQDFREKYICNMLKGSVNAGLTGRKMSKQTFDWMNVFVIRNNQASGQTVKENIEAARACMPFDAIEWLDGTSTLRLHVWKKILTKKDKSIRLGGNLPILTETSIESVGSFWLFRFTESTTLRYLYHNNTWTTIEGKQLSETFGYNLELACIRMDKAMQLLESGDGADKGVLKSSSPETTRFINRYDPVHVEGMEGTNSFLNALIVSTTSQVQTTIVPEDLSDMLKQVLVSYQDDKFDLTHNLTVREWIEQSALFHENLMKPSLESFILAAGIFFGRPISVCSIQGATQMSVKTYDVGSTDSHICVYFDGICYQGMKEKSDGGRGGGASKHEAYHVQFRF